MAFRIIRNDITKMDTDAIVNTANANVTVGPGCDSAVYRAAGYDELFEYRKEHIGEAKEGEAFLTPGFHLKARYIIHAVSPLYEDGSKGEEEKLRSCYQNSLRIARENDIRSIAFPLISTGSFGYPKEDGMRIAVDEIHAFLLNHDMEIFLVVFDDKAKSLGERIFPGLEEYIDRHYVEAKRFEEYGGDGYFLNEAMPERADEQTRNRPGRPFAPQKAADLYEGRSERIMAERRERRDDSAQFAKMAESAAAGAKDTAEQKKKASSKSWFGWKKDKPALKEEKIGDTGSLPVLDEDASPYFEEQHESRLDERMRHMSDTFSQYLMYLIEEKKLKNSDVYRKAIVDRKTFSKIKNNPDYHPQKLTALCLCVGARLNMDETRDLLARAGYALSPCDKTDIIFSYFIENGIYDMIELDIQLEEHGLPCVIA